MRILEVGASVLLLLAAAGLAGAQDRRTVTEPKRPPACTTLGAMLIPVGDSTLADGDETRLDTDRIQRALDGCRPGQAVVLRADGAKRAFLSAPLQLRQGVTLVIDSGAVLFASRNPRDYDLAGERRCGTVDNRGRGCRPLISADRAQHAGVMGPGAIDGRGWATLIGQDVSWWDLAQDAKARSLSQSCPRIMHLNRADDFTLYDITLRNSPNFHVFYERGTGFTAWGVIIHTPNPRARNTDGIDPSSSTNVTITRSFINTGDDNVAIKAGDAGPSTNITVSHNRFYRGHGVSIGSETNGGARAIRVYDLSIDGADNGLRIKSNASRGGLVEDVEYRDVCIRSTKNVIEMDTHYTASGSQKGELIPQYRDIRVKDVRVLDAGRVILDGYDAARPLMMAFDNVVFDKPDSIKVTAAHVRIRRGPGPTNLPLSGDDVQIEGATREDPPNPCEGKFVPIPRRAFGATIDSPARRESSSTIAWVPSR